MKRARTDREKITPLCRSIYSRLILCPAGFSTNGCMLDTDFLTLTFLLPTESLAIGAEVIEDKKSNQC